MAFILFSQSAGISGTYLVFEVLRIHPGTIQRFPPHRALVLVEEARQCCTRITNTYINEEVVTAMGKKVEQGKGI